MGVPGRDPPLLLLLPPPPRRSRRSCEARLVATSFQAEAEASANAERV